MEPRGRLASIDIVRGFAILWVLAYHLWTDLRFPNVYVEPRDAFREVWRQLEVADLHQAVAAALEAFLRVGYMGVPLFMILSGASLTLTAMQRSETPESSARDLPRRLRRVLVPYWAGFAVTVAFAAALAFVQWQRHGGDPYIDYFRDGDINMHTDRLLAGGFLAPRIWREEWQFAPEGSLWFVLVVLQYYLLFPFALHALRAAGPIVVAAAALAITIAALVLMVAMAGDLQGQRSWVEMGIPFRVSEFGLGIAIGWAVATGWAQRPDARRIAAAVGAAAFVAGCLITYDNGYASALHWPLISAGLGLAAAAFVMGERGSGDRAGPPLRRRGDPLAVVGRGLAWVGVTSLALLIVNEPLRSITHTLRAEGAGDGWLWAWVVLLYVPLTIALGRPLARVLGLLPRSA